MKHNRKYMEKVFNTPLPPLPEEERIYFNVPYSKRHFAKHTNCGFDAELKLWFTGVHNSHLLELVTLYGINEATSEKAMQLLKEKMESTNAETNNNN